jgi:glycerol kinase
MNRYLLAIDQGTTGSTALVMGMDGRTLGRESRELPQHFPEPAWVEHDPIEIQASVTLAVSGALRAAGVAGSEISRSASLTSARRRCSGRRPAVGRLIERSFGKIAERQTLPAPEERRSRARGARAHGLVLDPYFLRRSSPGCWTSAALGSGQRR